MQVDINDKAFEANESGFLLESTSHATNKYLFGQTIDDGELKRIYNYEVVSYDDLGIEESYSTEIFDVLSIKTPNFRSAFYLYIPQNQNGLKYKETIFRKNDKFWEVGYSKRYPSDISKSKSVETTYLLDAYYDFTNFTGFIEPNRLSQGETMEHVQDGIRKTLMRNPEAGKRFEKLYSRYLSRMNDEDENGKTR